MASAVRTQVLTRYTSLSSQQAHTFGASTYKVHMHAMAQAVRYKIVTGEADHYYTIDAGDELVIEDPSLGGQQVFFIEAAGSAALEILEFLKRSA